MDTTPERPAQSYPMSRRIADALFGPPLQRRLPDRVARAIAMQEKESEVLICLMQIGAIAFFGLLYSLTPKAFGPGVPFEPVPVTLAVYAAFTGARLVLALRGMLTARFLALSVLVDVAVLTITIWSFHLQYDQPAAVYLKAPTLLYVFIIIALRALRFDPRWVLLAGGASALGWLVLVVYAVRAGPMSEHITHSFVEYVSTPKLLVGAEVDKIVAIILVTAVIALAIERARRLLVRSLAEESARTELSRFFASDIAETIVGADETIRPGTGIARDASIMFIDLRGFTAFSSTAEPTEVVALLGEYQGIVVPIVRRHGGSIITYLGDGIMIAFGATREIDTYAADATRAAEDLSAALKVWAGRRQRNGAIAPEAGIGVASGRIVYGAIGTEGRLEYAVIGDPVNRAARLQGLTKSENTPVLIASDCWSLAVEQGYHTRCATDERRCNLRGLSEPLHVVAFG